MAIATLAWDETPPAFCRQGAATIGNFDGVHRGHLALLEALRKQAQAVHGPAVALTFDPPPIQLLRPKQVEPALTTVPDRAALLMAHGADHVLVLRTTPDLLQQTAAAFFQRVIRESLAARAMVEGVNFGFGRRREGNVDTLAELCRQAGLGLVVVPPLEWNGAIVSSSRVRTALQQGDVHTAADLLGRPYRLRGRVGTGRRRGQTIGFPTANLEAVETLVPADGVYAVRVHHEGTVWPGAANIGPNPTFGEMARKIEVHLIGFQGDLVGQVLTVEFSERLRDTRPFTGVEQLVEQLRLDVERARQLAGPDLQDGR
jgi:riboflavin kinase/FMN adenylyltransferase